MDNEFFDIKALANRLNVSVSTIRRLIKKGELKAVRIGRQFRFTVEAVKQLTTNKQESSNE